MLLNIFFRHVWLLTFSILSILQISNSFASSMDWSIVIYAGIDEDEIAQFNDPIIQSLINANFPANVELLMQVDTASESGTKRIIRRNNRTKILDSAETDSADRATFRNFLQWAVQEKSGTKTLFFVLTHSWGWKGIIQDFNLPGRPGENSMMRIKDFAKEIRDSRLKPDILFLDSCIVGNVEPLSEMNDLSPYIIASQRETPFNGFPYTKLIKSLERWAPESIRDLAKRFPAMYVLPYARGGFLAPREKEYNVVTAFTVETKFWPEFESMYGELVARLRLDGFGEFLQAHKEWPYLVADVIDKNYDTIEFLKRISKSRFIRSAVMAHQILAKIGYPEEISEKSREELKFTNVDALEIRIEADEYIESDDPQHSDEEPKSFEQKIFDKWQEANQGLELPKNLDLKVLQYEGKRWLRVRGQSLGGANFSCRVWLPATSKVFYSVKQTGLATFSHHELSRESTAFIAEGFGAESFLLAEAHSQGVPYIHGPGMVFDLNMNQDEERGEDPVTHAKGPDYYKQTRWSRITGWGDLLFPL